MTGNKNGFTLIEILVAAAIFAVALTSISALFVVSLKGQRNIVAQQNLVDNTRFAVESMARRLRMARRDGNGSCAGVAGNTYSVSGGGSVVTFLDYNNVCVTYRLDSSKIQAKEGGGAFSDLTSDNASITALEFEALGNTISDNTQPRVVVFVGADSADSQAGGITLQTTVSGRNLDVP